MLVAALTGFGGTSSGQPRMPEGEQVNRECLKCHDTLLDAKTLNPEIKEAHRRHLESTKTEFGGRQRVCLTCHEAFRKGKIAEIEGAPVKGYFHPATSNQPTEYWRLRVRKLEVPDTPAALPPLSPEDPQIFKPTLRRLVCLECHSRKLKVFYPAESR
jgi:nitrate reductase cytochrome c-type subunit